MKNRILLFFVFITFLANSPLFNASLINASLLNDSPETTTTDLYKNCINQVNKSLKKQKFDQALIHLENALKIKLENLRINNTIAQIAFKQKQWNKAIHHYEILSNHSPKEISFYYRLAQCFIKKRMPQAAIEYLKKIVTIFPNNLTALSFIAKLLQSKKNHKEALRYLRIALTSDPGNCEIIFNLCKSLIPLNKHQEAIGMLERILEREPENIQSLFQLARIYTFTGNNNQALTCYEKILKLKPNLQSARYNYAHTLKKMGKTKQAIEILEQLLIDNPNHERAHFCLANAYLSLGDFRRGWPEYEWRWQAYSELPPSYPQPTWNGSDICGKVILLTAEQGLGDTFQFIRYAQVLKHLGATIIVQSQKATTDMLRECDYIDLVIPRGKELPDFDVHIPLMSLPGIFKTTPETIPNDLPYLFAKKNLVDFWKEELEKQNQTETIKPFKIGICWDGNQTYRTESIKHTLSARSISLEAFTPIANIPEVVLYSLQKITGENQIENVQDLFKIHTFGQDLDTDNGRFMDTAAIIKNLDLVITIDTSIAHLSAGLGTPTWVMLPSPADWRWIIGRDDSPWYPGMKLFKQSTSGDWNSVIKNVTQKLKNKLQHKTKKTDQTKTLKAQLNMINSMLIQYKKEKEDYIQRFNSALFLKKDLEQKIKNMEPSTC